MGHKDHQTRTPRAVGSPAGVGRVPAPLSRSFRSFRGAAAPGTLSGRLADRTPQQELAAGQGGGAALLAGDGRRPAPPRLADRRRRQRRQAALLLERLRARPAAGAAGGVRAPAALGGAVSRRGQGAVGLGSVSGPLVDGVPPPRGAGTAGLQLPGLARVPAPPAGAPARPAAPAFFPRGPTVGACRCRRCIGAWSIDCDRLPRPRQPRKSGPSSSVVGWPSQIPCGSDNLLPVPCSRAFAGMAATAGVMDNHVGPTRRSGFRGCLRPQGG